MWNGAGGKGEPGQWRDPGIAGGTPPGIRYATTGLNWSQTISGSLSAGVQATVTLTPCPAGVDTTTGRGMRY